MSNNKLNLLTLLNQIGLSREEALIYVELLKEPNTHLRLSHITGINRTKVYRLVAELEKRSLVGRRSDDRGTFLVARDPASLEIELLTLEEKLKQQRIALQTVLPELDMIKKRDSSKFIINTYEGVEGFKQMQWHELHTKGELLVLGNVTVEELVHNRRWSEQFRVRSVEAGYKIREIINRDYDAEFTESNEFMDKVYTSRSVSEKELPIDTPVVIYNDTVAIYQFRHPQRVGVEIVNKSFANTMRHIFEHYWNLVENK